MSDEVKRGDRLANKVALVTGAAQGMGAACARRLAAGRAKVVLFDRQKEPLQQLAAEPARAEHKHAARPHERDSFVARGERAQLERPRLRAEGRRAPHQQIDAAEFGRDPAARRRCRRRGDRAGAGIAEQSVAEQQAPTWCAVLR